MFLRPNSKYKHFRLVIDLQEPLNNVKPVIKVDKKVILIDPGHGGEDPGALGVSSKEKDIVLAISKKLAKLINKTPGFKAILSRESDYFVNLSKRPRIAFDYKADVFISIHADSALRKSAHGASVYTLSEKGGTTPLAKKLEQSENANDIFENEAVEKDWVLSTIMRDLARDNKKQESYKLADSILQYLKNVGKLHKKTPQKANFVVLKTPAIPSVLVETNFLSNRTQEKKLNSNSHQNKIAKAIYQGIMKYFKEN